MATLKRTRSISTSSDELPCAKRVCSGVEPMETDEQTVLSPSQGVHKLLMCFVTIGQLAEEDDLDEFHRGVFVDMVEDVMDSPLFPAVDLAAIRHHMDGLNAAPDDYYKFLSVYDRVFMLLNEWLHPSDV
jgi:hypothetical protein